MQILRAGRSQRPGIGGFKAPLPNLCARSIKSQCHAKRALQIAAGGGHKLLMVGPTAPARACCRAAIECGRIDWGTLHTYSKPR